MHSETNKHFLHKAAQMRKLAAAAQNEKCRSNFLRVAQAYDTLALDKYRGAVANGDDELKVTPMGAVS